MPYLPKSAYQTEGKNACLLQTLLIFTFLEIEYPTPSQNYAHRQRLYI